MDKKNIFPTNREPITVSDGYEDINLHVVQCFREGLGFKLLSTKMAHYATWCLVVAEEQYDLVKHAFDFDVVLSEVV